MSLCMQAQDWASLDCVGTSLSCTLTVVTDIGQAVKSPSFLSSIVKTIVLQKPMHNSGAEDHASSSTPIVDLTGIDDILPAVTAVQAGTIKGDDVPFLGCGDTLAECLRM
ncbi:hypothetical protein IW262DRAFT_1462859 [Armillaria fumosa]|nr:hypothetical protein IW262DRAFT_1462859 [Armillaria fumosa]